MQGTSCEQVNLCYANPYHVLHPSPAGNPGQGQGQGGTGTRTVYVLLPNLHPQVGQHSSSAAGTTTPPEKSQEGDLQSTCYDGCNNRIVPSTIIMYTHSLCSLLH